MADRVPYKILACGHPFYTGETARCGMCDKCFKDCCKCPRPSQTIAAIEKQWKAGMDELQTTIRQIVEKAVPTPVPEKRTLTKAEHQRMDKDNG